MSGNGFVVQRDLEVLAPKFACQVALGIVACNNTGLDAFVYEAYRSPELQELYYKRGRPPTPEYPRPVTNARSNLYSWHGYGLAVDVISKTKFWSPPSDWWGRVAIIMKQHGLDWGGDWRQVDLPHFQWGRLRATPSDRARQLYAEGGMQRVWQEVGAV